MLEKYIEGMAADGRFESAGQIQMSLTSAMEKLGQGLEDDPELVLSRVCAGLVSLQGDEIWIRNHAGGVLVAIREPRKDWWPHPPLELALGLQGTGLKPLGLAILALGQRGYRMAWLRWSPSLQTHPLQAGEFAPPANPWGAEPAAGLWLEGPVTELKWSLNLYSQFAYRVYHSPLVIRWNRSTLGLDRKEAGESKLESEYLCLRSHPAGRLGARPRQSPGQEMWGKVCGPGRGSPRIQNGSTLLWVDGPGDLGWREGRGSVQGVLGSQNYRLYLGSLQIVFGKMPGMIQPLHHGERLRPIPIEQPAALRFGLTVYAPADTLATDLTHSRLLEDEAFQQWRAELLERLAEVVTRISAAEEEMESVAEGLHRQLWLELRQRHSPESGLVTRPPETQLYALSGLFGVASGEVKASPFNPFLDPSKGQAVYVLLPVGREFPGLWEALYDPSVDLASPSNPVYDLVRFCRKPPQRIIAIRLVHRRFGHEQARWVRDEQQRLSSILPFFLHGLLLEVYEEGGVGPSLSGALLPLRSGRDPRCQVWDHFNPFRSLLGFPKLVQQAMLLPLGIMKYLVLPQGGRKPERTLYRGFPPRGRGPGFTFTLDYRGLHRRGRCQLEGKVYDRGSLTCSMVYLEDPDSSGSPTRVLLYRFGICVEEFYADLKRPIQELHVDATDWDMDLSWQEQLSQDGWLAILEAATPTGCSPKTPEARLDDPVER